MDQPLAPLEFTTGNVIAGSFALYRRFFVRFLTLALIVFLPTSFVSALATVANSDAARALWLVAGIVISVIGFFWLQGALVLAIDDVRDGRADMTIGQTFERTRERLPYLVATSLLVGLTIGGAALVLVLLARAVGVTWIGAVAAFVLGVFLATRWAVSTAVVMLERRGPLQALERSWELVRGNGVRVFWIVIVAGILAGVGAAVINAVLGAVLSGFLQVWLTTAFANTLTAPFVALAWTLMYFHLRPGRPDE